MEIVEEKELDLNYHSCTFGTFGAFGSGTWKVVSSTRSALLRRTLTRSATTILGILATRRGTSP